MTSDQVLAIRRAFQHVTIQEIVAEFDPLTKEVIALVVIAEDQISRALRNSGQHAHEAASSSGISVEVVSPEELVRRRAHQWN